MEEPATPFEERCTRNGSVRQTVESSKLGRGKKTAQTEWQHGAGIAAKTFTRCVDADRDALQGGCPYHGNPQPIDTC